MIQRVGEALLPNGHGVGRFPHLSVFHREVLFHRGEEDASTPIGIRDGVMVNKIVAVIFAFTGPDELLYMRSQVKAKATKGDNHSVPTWQRWNAAVPA